MVNFLKERAAIITLLVVIAIFYSPFLFTLFSENAKLPIPSDTIVGLYHPYRDLYAGEYPNGIPFKNFLVTDPVRQTFIWKGLAVESFRDSSLPLWNPYEMAGKPLLANFQTGAFYPFNIILFIGSFPFSWSFFILSQSLLMGVFMYFYLRSIKLSAEASLLGSLSIVFCGFSISWLEWGTILHTALWLPLILISTDKIIKNWSLKWAIILILAVTFSFFGGHLQTFFYMTAISVVYLTFRIALLVFENKRLHYSFLLKKLSSFLVIGAAVLIFISIQLIPTLEFISLSSRVSDQNYTQAGWFLPYQNLIQFVAPDYFGNPATLNYFGEWNYAEFVGYIGLVSLMLALFAAIQRSNKETYFFLAILVVSLLFSTKNPVSTLPFQLDLPFLSSAQPTRLLFLASFSLSVLSAMGLDTLKRNRKIWIPIIIIGITLITLWFVETDQKTVSTNNLKLPIALFIASGIGLSGYVYAQKRFRSIFMLLVVVILSFDLLRFGWKFTPFAGASYLYPSTKSIEYLKSREGVFRIALLDRRILPPNFLTYYKIQTIEGYDPLYLNNYAQFVAAMERNEPNIKPPFGFNRIITPHNYNSPLFDFLNTEYVLSIEAITSPKFEKVFEEGTTKIYRNKEALPRTFFVNEVVRTSKHIEALFNANLRTTAVVSGNSDTVELVNPGVATISSYTSNKIVIKTSNEGRGFLVLSDTFYPTWEAYVDGFKTEILPTNHAFRGIFVPEGDHVIEFRNTLF